MIDVQLVSDLKALSTATYKSAYLLDPRRPGQWTFQAGDFSSRIAADTSEALYAKANDTSAALGAWVRIFDGPVKARWWLLAADLSGSTGTDDSSRLQAMAAAVPTGATIDWEGLQIFYSSNVIFTRDVDFIGRQASLYGSGAYIAVNGALSAKLANVSAAAGIGSRAISVSATAGFASGNLIIIHNHVAYSLNKQRPYYYDGSFQNIDTVSTGALNLREGLETKFAGISTDEVYRVDAVRFSSKGVNFFGTGAWALQLRFLRDSTFEGMVTGGTTRAIYIDKCYKLRILAGDFIHTAPNSGTNYGISFSNCQDCETGPMVRTLGTNEGVAMGGTDENGAVPCRRVVVRGGTHGNNTTLSGVDIHGCAVDCGYEDCTIYGAIGLSGHNAYARRNKVFANNANRPFLLKEIGGGDIEFTGNTVIPTSTFTSSAFLGVASTTLSALINESYRIICSDNVLECKSSITKLFILYHNASGYVDDNAIRPAITWSFIAHGNRVRGDTSGLATLIDCYVANDSPAGPFTNPGKAARRVSMPDLDGVESLASSVTLAAFSGSGWSVTRWTLPSFSFSGTLTIPSGGYQSGNLTLTHPKYPGVPNCYSSGALGYSGAARVDTQRLTGTVDTTTVRLCTSNSADTVAAAYTRNVQATVSMVEQTIA